MSLYIIFRRNYYKGCANIRAHYLQTSIPVEWTKSEWYNEKEVEYWAWNEEIKRG